MKYFSTIIFLYFSCSMAWAQVPSITSFSPTSGAVGTTVTITGTNFNTTAANNTVWFGAVKTTPTAASATSLTVIVPKNASSLAPIVVLNTVSNKQASSLTRTSGLNARLFNVTTPVTWTPNTAYYNQTSYAMGTGTRCVAVGDVDGDGDVDIVTANRTSDNASVRLNDGNGNFGAATNITLVAGAEPRYIILVDFDGDGDLDLATANALTDNISIRMNNGSGTFAGGSNIAVGNTPRMVQAGDFDNDGDMDIVTTNNVGNNISIRLNNGAGTFSGTTNYVAGTAPEGGAVGDFNRDGNADIVVGNQTSNNTMVYLGNGDGTFAVPTTYAVGNDPQAVAVADFDEDGKLDFATSNQNGGPGTTVTVRRDAGVASFTTTNTHTVDVGPEGIVVADINGDGNVDFATPSQSTTAFSIKLGNGDGSFQALTTITMGVTSPETVAFADFNGDGRMDFVTSHFGSSIVRVCLTKRPTITSFTPTNGTVGTTVTITGTGFNPTFSNHAVYFGAIKATPTAGSGTSLTVTVPAGATSITPIAIQDITTGLQVSSIENASTELFTVTISPNTLVNTPAYEQTNLTSSGGQSWDIAVADFNNDGFSDFCTADLMGNHVRIHLNNGSGGFNPGIIIANGTQPRAVASQDFNGDGNADIASVNYNMSQASIFLGNGAGGFTFANTVAVGANPIEIALGDFNNDGKIDLATANSGAASVSIRLGVGNGSFTGTTNIALTTNPFSLVVSDFNADGNADIATANFGTNNTSILLGNGTGTFAGPTTIVMGNQPYGIATADFNNDGNLDLAVSNDLSSNVTVRFGNGAGAFPSIVTIATPSQPRFIATGDFNGDGNADWVVACGAMHISVGLGTGAGTFSTPINIRMALGGSGIATTDLNKDGKADFITSNSNGSATVFLWRPVTLGATNVTTTGFTANWNTVTDATSYRLDVATDVAFSALVVNNLNVGNVTAYNVTSLTAGIYYYRVRAVGSVASPNSSVRTISTNLPAGSGNTITFDGAGSETMDIKHHNEINFGSTSNFTLEAWVKPNGIGFEMDIISKRVMATSSYAIGMNSAGKLQVVGDNSAGSSVSGDVTVGKWSHIAVSVTGGTTYTYYLNGVLLGSGTFVGMTHNTQPLTIGSAPDGSLSFNGQIDEARVWNVARTQAQIQASMCAKLVGNEAGLIVYLRLDENIGLNLENKAFAGVENAVVYDGSFWNVSGAPLGDISANTYGGSTITLTDTDALTANSFLGTPAGVHLYKVNATPNSTGVPSGYNAMHTDRYWGMFLVGGTAPTANLTYNYTTNTNVILENALRFAKRDGNADNTWAINGGIPRPNSNTVLLVRETQGEFALATRNITTPTFVNGGMVLDLNGSNGVTIPNPVSTNFTIEFWMRSGQASTGATNWYNGARLVSSTLASNGTQNDYGVSVLAGKLAFGIGNTTIVSTTSVNTGQWFHVAVKREISGANSILTIILNGGKEVVTSNTSTNISPLTASTNLTIGNRNNTNFYFTGEFDELRFWDIVLPTPNIGNWMNLRANQNHVNISNLVGYYRFDENTGILSEDLTSGSDAIMTSATMWVASTQPLADGNFHRLTVNIASQIAVFTNAGVTINFGATVPNGEVVVTQLDAVPNNFPAVAGMSFMNSYWVIRNYGSNQTFSLLPEIKFEVPAGNTISATDLANPNNIKLYKRPDNSVILGDWTGVARATGFGSVIFSEGPTGGGGTTIEDFSQFVIGSPSSALPITLLGLKGERVEGQKGEKTEEVHLEWSTASESNNKGFEIEMSEDGLAYRKIAFIDGKGNSTTIQLYDYTTIQTNEAYYRLKQIDFDGKYSYSPVIFVEGLAGKDFLRVYPNPVQSELHLKIVAYILPTDILKMEVYTLSGKCVWRGTGRLADLEVSLQSSFRSWKSGTYLLLLRTKNKRLQTKFVRE